MYVRFCFCCSSGSPWRRITSGALDDTALARRLTVEAGVATIPVSVFYATDPGHTMLRLCFAKDDATLARGAEILCSL